MEFKKQNFINSFDLKKGFLTQLQSVNWKTFCLKFCECVTLISILILQFPEFCFKSYQHEPDYIFLDGILRFIHLTHEMT